LQAVGFPEQQKEGESLHEDVPFDLLSSASADDLLRPWVCPRSAGDQVGVIRTSGGISIRFDEETSLVPDKTWINACRRDSGSRRSRETALSFG
jgi:hypothetical protein